MHVCGRALKDPINNVRENHNLGAILNQLLDLCRDLQGKQKSDGRG